MRNLICKISVCFCLFGSWVNVVQATSCLYISSYHQGYQWSDGIEQGLTSVLAGKCILDKFYMDTKRHKSAEYGEQIGLQARDYIFTTKPDVVIACDDNASRYIITPYFKDHAIPFVFCGVNHNTKAYGYPYTNVTGIIEIAPVKPLLKVVTKVVPDVELGIYLSVDVHSQHKEYELNRKIYQQAGIQLDRIMVQNMDQWIAGYQQAQQDAEFVIIGSNGGLAGWDKQRAQQVVAKDTRVFTVTNMAWMIDYAMLAMTKVPQEQGEWAGQVALEILAGAKPIDIPIVANHRWDIFVNPANLQAADIQLPRYIMHKAVKK